MNPSVTAALPALADLVAQGDVMVLTGAGLSTESGIPDYRGPSGALRRAAPMTYQTFTGDPDARRRYWARSFVGWRTIRHALPNAGHRAVADLQRHGVLTGIVTQNVDGLHQAGGAHSVVELHGALDRVVCLRCGDRTPRARLDERLTTANPDFAATVDDVRPDGDAEIPDAAIERFQVVDCDACAGGLLKPDVVFFGESVPPARVRESFALVERSRSMLVLGSSLTVMSGRRFVLHAAKRGIPVAIVNQGATRGDAYATVTVDAPLGAVLAQLAARTATTVAGWPAHRTGAGTPRRGCEPTGRRLPPTRAT